VDNVTLSEVAGQHSSTSRAGVPLGKQSAANSAVIHERGTVHTFDRDGPFHVAELADIVVTVIHGAPTQQRVAHGLQCLLVLHNALPLMHMPGGVTMHEGGYAGSPGLLHLQENHVVRPVSLQQRNERSQTDAANANYFMSYIYDQIRAENSVPMRRKGLQVG